MQPCTGTMCSCYVNAIKMQTYLLRLWQWLRSIETSMSVCVSVCLRGYLWKRMFNLYQIFVHVAYIRGSVLLRHVDDRPHRLSAGRDDGTAQQRGQSVIYNCLVFECNDWYIQQIISKYYKRKTGCHSLKLILTQLAFELVMVTIQMVCAICLM